MHVYESCISFCPTLQREIDAKTSNEFLSSSSDAQPPVAAAAAAAIGM